MAVELIYTSAPKTMDGPGYGVVAKSANLPQPLEEFIRELNRYDFAMSSGPDAAASPVVFSHTTLVDAGATWHVMSRVGAGGVDYSQRAVFLAHHVAASSDEMAGATAPDLMQSRGMFHSKWDGHVGLLPGRPLPAFSGRRSRAAWGLLAGDPDWAKVWVDRWSRNEGAPSFVIAPGDSDILGLFGEALELLAPEEARQITFISPMGADHAGVQFDWIGLASGSNLARATLARFPGRTLDLSTPKGRAPKTAVPRPRAGSATSRATAATESRGIGLADWEDPESAPTSKKRSRSTSRNRSDQAGAGSKLPPPPPPPAMIGPRYATPLLIFAGFALAMMLGAIAWKMGFIRPGGGKDVVAQATQNGAGSAESNTVESRTGILPREGQAARRATDEARAQNPARAESGTGEPPRTTDLPIVKLDGPGPRIVTLDGWLADKLSQDTESPWVPIVAIDAKVVPPSSRLSVSSITGSGLGSSPRRGESGDNGIEIVLESTSQSEHPKLEFQLKKGEDDQTLVTVRRPEKQSEDLMDRLPLCVLEIYENQTGVREPAARVFLAPVLPGVPLDPKKPWLNDSPLESGARGFFGKLGDLKASIDVRIRLDYLTLPFLPPADNRGWRLAAKGETWQLQPGDSASTNLPVTLPDDQKLSVSVGIETHPGGQKNAPPPIGARLSRPEAPANRRDEQDELGRYGTGRALNEPVGRDPINKPDGTHNRAGSQKTPKKSAKPNPPRGAGGSHNAGPPKASPKLSPAKAQKVDHAAFMLDLLQRYGQIRGSVVVRAKNGTPGEETEVLRFGGGPSGPLP